MPGTLADWEVINVLARPGLPSFDYVRAGDPDEVVRLLNKHGEAAQLVMGGTDLFVRMRDGFIRPQVVVDVKHMPGMRDIVYDPQAGLTVGAAVTMNEIARKHELFVIEDAAQSFGAEYKGRKACSLADIACTSFFPAKPLGCYGDGGMILRFPPRRNIEPRGNLC